MPKRILPLSDKQISKAKSSGKDYALRDGGGLYLVVTPTGGKLWRLDYRFAGKRLTLSMGAYPTLSLAEAREKRGTAKKQILSNIDPNTVKKAERMATTVKNTFEAVAREWHLKFCGTWTEDHAERKLTRLTKYIFTQVGCMDVNGITAQELLAALSKISSPDIMHRVRYDCVQVMRYAIATGRASRNIAEDLRGTLPPVKGGHHAAITDPTELGVLYSAINEYTGSVLTKCALKLQVLLFVRPTELRMMKWSEIDGHLWSIPADRMKMKLPHVVPLCSQAMACLDELRHITGKGKLVFPSQLTAGRPMSENTVNTALRRMGYSKEEVTGHGFRATARTILDEVLHVRVDLIEHQLAHSVRDTNGRAYNRTSFIPERILMMQQWGDYLDELAAYPICTVQPAPVSELTRTPKSASRRTMPDSPS